MRLRNVLALVVAGLALSALAAAPASATRLCLNNTTDPCSAVYAKGQMFEATLKTKTIAEVGIGAFGPVKCTGSTSKGQSTDAGGGAGVAVGAQIEAMTWSTCTCTLGNASVTPVFPAAPNNFWKAEIKWQKEKSGTLVIANPKIQATCDVEKCVYEKAQIEMSFKGGNPGEITALSGKVKLTRVDKESTIGCGGEAELIMTYEITKPKPVYVTNA
jgi:hypothetical protein